MYLEIGGLSKPQSGLTTARIFRSSGKSRSLISDVAGHSVRMCWVESMSAVHSLQPWSDCCCLPSTSREVAGGIYISVLVLSLKCGAGLGGVCLRDLEAQH